VHREFVVTKAMVVCRAHQVSQGRQEKKVYQEYQDLAVLKEKLAGHYDQIQACPDFLDQRDKVVFLDYLASEVNQDHVVCQVFAESQEWVDCQVRQELLDSLASRDHQVYQAVRVCKDFQARRAETVPQVDLDWRVTAECLVYLEQVVCEATKDLEDNQAFQEGKVFQAFGESREI
jgi:hypothetical protein